MAPRARTLEPRSGLSGWPFEEINEFRHDVGAREHDAELLDRTAPERQPPQVDEAAELQDDENQLDQDGQLENKRERQSSKATERVFRGFFRRRTICLSCSFRMRASPPQESRREAGLKRSGIRGNART